MSEAILLPHGYDIIGEVVNRLGENREDYSQSMIVFPGKRPAMYVRKRISSLTNSSYFPPKLLSMDQFVDHIYEVHLGKNDRKIDIIDGTALLLEIHHRSNNPIGGENFKRPEEFLPLGMEMFRELEEICMSDVSPRRVQEHLSAYDERQLGALGRYFSEFYDMLSTRKFSTRALRYRTVSHKIHELDLEMYDRIIIAGFYVLTNSERRIFGALQNRRNVIFLFQDGKGMKEHLRELNISVTAVTGPSRTPLIRLHKSTDTHGQVLGLSSIINELIQKGTQFDEQSVIVTPSAETLFPLIQHTLPLLDENGYNVSLGYPVTRSTLHGFLMSVMEVILSREENRYYAPDYIRFALHPYTKNIRFGKTSEPSRILFHTLEEYLIEHSELNFFTLEELEQHEKLLRLIHARLSGAGFSYSLTDVQDHLISIHNHTIRELGSPSSIGDFAKRCSNLVTYIHDESTARNHPLFNHFAGHLLESLADLQSSLIASIALETPKAYSAFFKYYTADITIPFSGTPLKGLQVLGFLETRSLTFDRVFFLDANDDVISRARREEVLLPDGVRQKLGMPTYRDREKVNRYYLDLLVHNSREVDFFYVERDDKEKSRYLEQLIWETEKKNEKLPIHSIRYRVRLTNPTPGPIRKLPAVTEKINSMKFSATALDTYLKCPLRFYYRYILMLEERAEIGEEIDQLMIGSIVHEVLKRYFTPLKGAELTTADIDINQMENIVEEVFRETFGERLVGKPYLLRRQCRKRMVEFLRSYQLPHIEGNAIKIIDVETPLETPHGDAILYGKIDRLEKRNESVYIIDYKISYSSDRLQIAFDKLDPDERSTWYSTIGSLQLPVYMILYSSNFNEPIDHIEPVYLLLGKHKIDNAIEHSLFTRSTDRAHDLGMMNSILSKLLDEIRDPSHEFLPTADLRTECPSCPYNQMCGTLWTQS